MTCQVDKEDFVKCISYVNQKKEKRGKQIY